MSETSLVPLLQVGMKPFKPNGEPEEWFRNAWNALVLRTGTETENAVFGVINGATSLQAQLAAEAAARIAGDRAAGSSGDGTGPSNGGTWSNGASAGAAWVALISLTVTPGGAGGDYTVSATPDASLGLVTPASGLIDNFFGNWRLVEELTAGGPVNVLATDTFQVSFTPESQQYVGEGGGSYIVIPAMTGVEFANLPTGLLAANNAAQSDIRLEIQRASGTTEVANLSGAMTVVWTA